LGINIDAQICSRPVFWLRRIAPCFSHRPNHLRGVLTARPFCFQGWHSDFRVGFSYHPFVALRHTVKNLAYIPAGFPSDLSAANVTSGPDISSHPVYAPAKPALNT